MNREIKFRIWDVENKKFLNWEDTWYSTFLLPENNIYGWKEVWISFLGVVFKSPDTKYIPQQYTCLQDKKGKEIYEGDILTIMMWQGVEKGDQPEVCKLIWSQEKLAFRLIFPYQDGEWGFTNGNELEVIGNIFENPELFK